MKKLNPCPFCGGKARLISRKKWTCKHNIGCSEIGCILHLPNDVKLSELHNYGWTYRLKKDAVEAWNKRNTI